MTLEDFFTLTEIKDGLTVTSRVEELLSVMQSNKDSVLKNAGDASRQWAAVASTIAATKNRECLDVFVNLDGLRYLSSWLAEAQRLANDLTDSSIEESILVLLRALENLGVYSSRYISPKIWVVVKKLVDHGNSRVQDQARKLFGSLEDNKIYDHSECDTESSSKIHEGDMKVVATSTESSVPKSAGTLCSRQSNNDKPCLEIVEERKIFLSGNSEKNNPGQDKGSKQQNENVGFDTNVASYCSKTMTETLKGISTDGIMKEVQENLSVKEESSLRVTIGPTNIGTNPTGSSSLLYSELDSVDGPSGAPLAALMSKEKQMGISVNFPDKLGGTVASSSLGHVAVSSDFVVPSMKELEKSSLLQRSLDSDEVSRNATETICGPQDLTISHNSKHVPALTRVIDNQGSEGSSRLSGGHGILGNAESGIEAGHADSEGKNDEKGHCFRERRVKRRRNRSSRSMTISQCLGVIDRTTVDIELGIVDALEVATKVAQQVAREVDSGEPSLSSSEEVSVESGHSASQDSCGADLCTSSPSKGLSVGENHFFEEEPHGEHDEVMDVKNNKPGKGILSSDDVEKRQLGTDSKSEMGREKSPCDFDLNQDIYSDETDLIVSSISATTTASITATMPISHASSASGMPAALWQLERTSSLKGTAATSAFHAVSPPNFPSGNLREKQVICRGIDLNVAEVGEDQVEDLAPWKQICFSSSNLRGGESSQEVNPRGSSRFNLDLNCPNEDGDMPPPYQSKMETRLFLNHNGQPSSSPASSLSSVPLSGKEVNFDLNDRPEFFIDSHNQSSYYAQHPWITAPYGGHKLDGPVISILGTKVDVNRKDSVSVASFFSNGKSLEPTTGIYMARTANSLGLAPGVSFSPTPIYGYNGMTAPPGLSVSSPMYVPGNAIPYMDSRGSPVMMPQIIGSTMQTSFPQQHLFMNLAGGSSSLNGSVRPNFDQCSGLGVEVGNRESLALRQFLSPGQSGVMGEHSGANVDPSSASSIIVGGKRKEPETRWEFPPWR